MMTPLELSRKNRLCLTLSMITDTSNTVGPRICRDDFLNSKYGLLVINYPRHFINLLGKVHLISDYVYWWAPNDILNSST